MVLYGQLNVLTNMAN